MQTDNAADELAEMLALLSDADRAEVLAGFAKDESESKERMREVAIDEFSEFVDRMTRRPVKRAGGYRRAAQFFGRFREFSSRSWRSLRR